MATHPEFRKTILIGLGGAGQQIVLRTKRFFLDTFGALPPSIKILCLDTDDEALKLRSAVRPEDYAIAPEEFLHLAVSNPSEFIAASAIVKAWYVKPVPVGAISRGAGAVRQNGRLALFYHVNEIITRIDKLLADLNDPQLATKMDTARERLGSTTAFKLAPKETEIYVCGSLAGGTGSGTFLDIGLLLRDKCINSLIHGFFLLPWVYRNKAFAYRVFQNTYAGLAELDNLQSIMFGDPHFIPYEVHYGNRKVVANKAPYDLFHLIDGRNELGENIDDVGALCETIATALFLSIGSMSYRVDSVIDNLLAFINVSQPRLWNGRYARYSSLGVSSIHYPARELHRLLTASNALDLCTTAIRQLQSSEAGGEEFPSPLRQPVQQQVDKFINELNLHRNNIRNHLCADQAQVTLPLENFEIADAGFPGLLKAKLEGTQKTLEQALQAGFQGAGKVFMENLQQHLDRRLRALAEDPQVDSATRHEWGACLVDHLKRLRDDTAQDLVEADKNVHDHQENADQLLQIACNSRYLPFLGGNRKRASFQWATEIGEYLSARKRQINLSQEKQFYETLLKRAETEATLIVPSTSEIGRALLDAESELRQLRAREEKNLEILRNRPNHVLLGYGTVVVVPHKGSQLYEDISLNYQEFVQTNAIHNPEDYLRRHRAGPGKLAVLFLDHCRQKLQDLTSIDVDTALQTLARESGAEDTYLQQQFDHLFRLSAALWNFDRGRITPEQAGQMDKILNLGFPDHEACLPHYEKTAKAAKAGSHIRNDLAYSTTGDPSHIWLLNYAAALPGYFLSGLREARDAYLEQITPTYHVDAYFEMNVPDLFPVDELDNKVLRVLGMAIVAGIDVIHDEKLTKGHKFSCTQPEVTTLNYDDPKTWLLFRDMYAEIKDYYDPSRSDNLYDILVRLLRERVSSLSRDELRAAVEEHIAKLRAKLDRRDFSRLVSARLTYREIRALEDFLAKPPRGYAMNLDHYLTGTLR